MKTYYRIAYTNKEANQFGAFETIWTIKRNQKEAAKLLFQLVKQGYTVTITTTTELSYTDKIMLNL